MYHMIYHMTLVCFQMRSRKLQSRRLKRSSHPRYMHVVLSPLSLSVLSPSPSSLSLTSPPSPPLLPHTQRKREEHPQIRKAVKSESLDNEVLRAFGRAVTATYRVASGKEALDMLLRSGLTKQVRHSCQTG